MCKNLKICPVCGFDKLSEPPYDNYGYPSYEICPCCNFEFGFDDSSENQTFKEYREKWIENGYEFNSQSEKPINWNTEKAMEQLKNIDKVDYKPRLLD